jgi:hypothetical protein
LLATPVGYNACTDIDPWDKSLMLLDKKGVTKWANEYFIGY